MKQRQQEPLSLEKQIVILYAGTRGYLDRSAVADIGSYERELYTFLETRHAAILPTLAHRKQFDKQLASALDEALEEFDTVRRTAGFAGRSIAA